MDHVCSCPRLHPLFVAIAAVGTDPGRAAARRLVADFPGAVVEIEVPRTDRDLLGKP